MIIRDFPSPSKDLGPNPGLRVKPAMTASGSSSSPNRLCG
jgi:hypothetical protein